MVAKKLQHGLDRLQLFGDPDVLMDRQWERLAGEHEFDQMFSDVLDFELLAFEQPDLPLLQWSSRCVLVYPDVIHPNIIHYPGFYASFMGYNPSDEPPVLPPFPLILILLILIRPARSQGFPSLVPAAHSAFAGQLD